MRRGALAQVDRAHASEAWGKAFESPAYRQIAGVAPMVEQLTRNQ